MARASVRLWLLLPAAPQAATAQGPLPAYYYEPGIELSWGSAGLVMGGGSRLALPFLPAVTPLNAPYGSADYSRDVLLEAPLVFVPGAPAGVELRGKVAFMPIDPPGGPELTERLGAAVRAGAVGILLFSMGTEHPFVLDDDGLLPDGVDLPIISVSRDGAGLVLAGSALSLDQIEQAWAEDGPPSSRELITRLELEMATAFQSVETEHFLFRFQPGHFRNAREIAGANDDAVAFLLGLFEGHVRPWSRTTVTYFPDFDSKTFFTHHWGSGLGADHGIFLVQRGPSADRGLVIHEQAHILIGRSWEWSTSFMAEGVASYAEAMATDPDGMCRKVLELRDAGELYPLEEMLTFQVGVHQGTGVAYPAGGCFVRYLVEAHSMESLRSVYALEARSAEEKAAGRPTWVQALGMQVEDVETAWLAWAEEAVGR